MNGLTSITPEPINLINGTSDDVKDILNDNDSQNRGISINKVYVSDYNIIDNEIAVWKLTIIISRKVGNLDTKLEICKYKRYSDFKNLRDEMILDNNKKELNRKLKIPELPPAVPWYNKWQYNHANLNAKWLNKRQQGLEYFINYIISDPKVMAENKNLIYTFLDI